MALRSMTGFGRAEREADGWRLEVECKSVNRDRCDVRVHLPSEISRLEPAVRDRVESRVGRGKVDVSIELEWLPGSGSESPRLFEPDRFESVAQELQNLVDTSGVGPIAMSDVLEFREEFERDEPVEIDEDDQTFVDAVEAAVDELVASRTEEGVGLENALREHLGDLRDALDRYGERVPEEMERLRGRLEERVREALDEFDGLEPDDERLAREVVYHADRADVSEELQRAESHVETLGELIDESEVGEPVGKELDFYLQELVRETNTLASKTVTADSTDLAVSMKSTVGKMREQVANVE